MSLRAYQQAAARAEAPRELEYRLFGQVTRALIAASQLDASEVSARVDALDWNRRVWSVLGADCASPENQLPTALRAQIISLSIWVAKYTSLVIRGQDDMEALIDINKIMMQGLSGGAEAA
jgi:flagellar biosynthesis activator protein FlaF